MGYQRYASITGQLVRSVAENDIDSVAGIDRQAGRARIVLGNRLGDGSELGTVKITIAGLDNVRHDLEVRSRVPLRLERIPDTTVLNQPEILQDLELKITGDRTTIDIPWANSNDAYVITLGQQDSTLPRLAIVNASPSPAIMLPGNATPISFVLRNFTDRPITVRPTFDVSAGYAISAPDQVTVPVNGDAQVNTTVTRSSAEQTPGDFTMTVLRESETVLLVPSDNWVRIAAFTASSTHSPSAVTNLNNGDTDSEHWGAGGAGGWNDDTAGQFPDTVTATWTHPVPLSRVTVFTLDSQGYPASAWGVRDYDLRVRLDGQWQTVAQIRGNLAGVIETSVQPVRTDGLQISILDTNDHAYSRLVELEAHSN